MSEETLFDTTAFVAETAAKPARKRATAKAATAIVDAAAEVATPKRRKGPRTIAEALLANEQGGTGTRTRMPAKPVLMEAPPIIAAVEPDPAPSASTKGRGRGRPASTRQKLVADPAAPVESNGEARKPENGTHPVMEPAANRAVEPAPGRDTDLHASLAAAAQSARHVPHTAVAEVAAAPSEQRGAPPAHAHHTVSEASQPPAPTHPGQEGHQPRERFGRRQRWKERRARDRDQRGGRPHGESQGQDQAPSSEGAGSSSFQPQSGHRQSHHSGQQQPHQGGQQQPHQGGQQQDRGERDREPEKLMGPPEAAEGILELSPKGHGFLRVREKLFAQLPNDVFVHGDMIRKFALREGMCLVGLARRNSRGLQMTDVTTINGRTPGEVKDLPLFEELKATNPCKRYQLETKQDRMTTRVIDMMTPVGRGQRGLIVAPPRAGKTTLLQHIAEAMVANYTNVHLMILLVDERPEEVTEFRRVLPQAEIFASSNDSDVKSHTRIAQFAIERAKRLVEMGEHVFMLMDSITRLARAFNNANNKGATGSGGMGVGSMEIPRRLFAAARNTKTAGSLTILATALIETGSRMDDVIFAEFKGTGNMELVLDRKIAEQFIYPAVNIFKSGTRREELLLPAFQIEKIHMLRRGLAGHKPIEAIQRVLSLLERYPSNAQMLLELPSK